MLYFSQLDNIRISAAKSSPVVEAINFCLPFTDGEVMEELIPHLVTVIKGGVGMATKVKLVTSLPLMLQRFW